MKARCFASFLHWLLEAKRFASFTQTTIHILWAWKQDVSIPSPIGCWRRNVLLPSSIGYSKRNVSLLSPKQQYIYCGRGSETFRFLPPLVVGSETFRFFPPLVVGSETFRFFHPNNNTYIVGMEVRRFASFPHWLLEARRFASFLHWLLEAKRFASFTQTTIHILWAWKRDVSLPSSIGCWKRDVLLLSSIGCWKRNVSLLSPKQQYIYCGRGSETLRFLPPLVVGSETFRFRPLLVVGSETFRFFYPNNNTYIVGVEARRFASFPHWLLEVRRFASFLHWMLEAKRFASFTETTIHILWA